MPTRKDLASAFLRHIIFEGERIAEFWDVSQAQPEEMKNDLGMF